MSDRQRTAHGKEERYYRRIAHVGHAVRVTVLSFQHDVAIGGLPATWCNPTALPHTSAHTDSWPALLLPPLHTTHAAFGGNSQLRRSVALHGFFILVHDQQIHSRFEGLRSGIPCSHDYNSSSLQTAYEIASCLVGSEMCIRDRILESFGKWLFRLRVRVGEFSSKNFEGSGWVLTSPLP